MTPYEQREMAEKTPYEQDIAQTCQQGLDLSRFRGKTILVAGATGLVGSCIVDVLMHCKNGGFIVVAAGRNRERARKKFAAYWDAPHFAFVEMDVTQPINGDRRYDYIINAASNASPNFFKQKPVEVIKANIDGVAHLMDYGLAHGMQRMLYVSSGEIYGEGNGETFTERSSGYVDCASVRACYPSSKRAAETLCMAYAEEYGADVVVARLCHTYGPGFTESDNRVYAQFIRNVRRGEDIVLKSRGEQFRSWLYVVDAAAAILHLLLYGERSQAYNVANAQANITIRQLAELIAAEAGHKVRFDIPQDQQQGNTTPITKATFDTKKIAATGWQPLWSIEEGIAHTIHS